MRLLDEQTTPAEPAFGNPRMRGEVSTLSGTKWREVLVNRLERALMEASAYNGFDQWMGMVGKGAYSTRGLKGANALTRSLRRAGI